MRGGLSRFAGRALDIDQEVFESEMANNRRNQGIAHLLDSYDRMYFDPDEATEVYTRQCSLRVSATDLAVMGATLADGGVNPVTGERVVTADTCMRVLAVLATAGLYERSGDWLYEVGLPGKSGVSGGIVTVSPGKGAIGTFSPPLDEAGNSVRGQALTRYLSQRLGLNLFASQPETERTLIDPLGRVASQPGRGSPAAAWSRRRSSRRAVTRRPSRRRTRCCSRGRSPGAAPKPAARSATPAAQVTNGNQCARSGTS